MSGISLEDTVTEQGNLMLSDAPRKNRILVVDDNEDSATSLAAMFDMLGHEARVAFDGAAALEVAEQFKPDVVLLDIGLPILSGHEVARTLRAQQGGQNLFLVAVTGWGDDKDRLQSAEAGFDLHLVKPIDPAALEQLLSRRLST